LNTLCSQHQYVDRETRTVKTERIAGDRMVRAIYSPMREYAPALFRALTSRRTSRLLGFVRYDMPGIGSGRVHRAAADLEVDLDECVDVSTALSSPRSLFERQIRYWECRPMVPQEWTVVSPADARCLIGSRREHSMLFIKEKHYTIGELLGERGSNWDRLFRDGDFAVFRLTPDKYHYNHVPVSGRVTDVYGVDGYFHSCNPSAVVAANTHAKNMRVVTVLDTDVPGGSGVGYVAMVETVALMVGAVAQVYSETRYDNPREVRVGMFLRRGQPKSLYRPGSSVDVLIFEEGAVRFASDLQANTIRNDVRSRYTLGFGRPVVETDVRVRSLIAWRSGSDEETAAGRP
jgi:phosphatidylserine decarboxylase